MNTLQLQKQTDGGGVARSGYVGDTAKARALKNIGYYGIFIMDPSVPKKMSLRKRICDAFEIPEEVLFDKTRKREVVNARQVYTFLVKKVSEKLLKELEEKTKPRLSLMNNDEVLEYKRKLFRLTRNKTLSPLGNHIGGKDHATIVHTMKAVNNYYETEPFYRNLIDSVTEEIYCGRVELPMIEQPMML